MITRYRSTRAFALFSFFILLAALSALTGVITAAYCQVKSFQKISETAGGFTEDLDNNEKFGNAMDLLGDLDGDGVDDILVAAYHDGYGSEWKGALYVLFMNADGTVKSNQKISEGIGGFTGELDYWDDFGVSVANMGDLDGDGVVDLAVGARLDDDGGTNRGAVWILFLDTDGTVKSHQKISDTAGGFTGTLDNGDWFGTEVDTLGDFDDDGVNDLLVSAPYDDDGGADRGAVWILYLNSNGTVHDYDKINDTTPGFSGVLDDEDHFGWGAAMISDLDSDGIVDIAVGAKNDDDGGAERGAVYVLFLEDDASIKGYQKISDTQGGFTGVLDDNDQFGSALAPLIDADGTSVIGVIVGALYDDDGGTDRGAAWILFLNTDGTVKGHVKISDTAGGFTAGLDNGDEFGLGVAPLGDFDGDGAPDIMVGARKDDDGGTDQGAAYLLFLTTSCSIEPQSIDFGGVIVGNSKDETFTIANPFVGLLTGTVSESCDHYQIISGAGAFALALGESLDVTVRFEPTSIGSHSCMIETGTYLCTDVSCTGFGSMDSCTVDPASIDFGAVEVYTHRDTTFTILNDCCELLTGTVSESCAHYSIIAGGGYYALSIGQSRVVTVRFEPTPIGPYDCTIETGNDLLADVVCTGSSYQPDCYFYPPHLDFGVVAIDSMEERTFTLKNNCCDSLYGIVSEICDHYSLVNGGGPYALAVGESLIVTVRYEPTEYGTHYCTIETGDATCSDVTCTGYCDASGQCSKQGDPGIYIGFGDETFDVTHGENYCWDFAPANFGFVSGSCPDTDTFCLHVRDTQGWIILGDPPLEQCWELDPGYFWNQGVCITVPCETDVCDYDTVIAVMAYCNESFSCMHGCTDAVLCEDPNWYDGNAYYSADTIVLHIVESPPSLMIVQDSLYTVEQGQTGAYVPFTICNADICAGTNSYSYTITSTGNIGGTFPQSGSTGAVPPGECENVFAIVDAGTADVYTVDTLTIVAWDQATGATYDTCVQIVQVVEGCFCVPLFSTPVLIILVAIMIVAAAVLLKRRSAPI